MLANCVHDAGCWRLQARLHSTSWPLRRGPGRWQAQRCSLPLFLHACLPTSCMPRPDQAVPGGTLAGLEVCVLRHGGGGRHSHRAGGGLRVRAAQRAAQCSTACAARRTEPAAHGGDGHQVHVCGQLPGVPGAHLRAAFAGRDGHGGGRLGGGLPGCVLPGGPSVCSKPVPRIAFTAQV